MELNWSNYSPGENTIVITTIDTHAAGEPLRIVTGGMPALPGATMLARRRYMQEQGAFSKPAYQELYIDQIWYTLENGLDKFSGTGPANVCTATAIQMGLFI